VLGWVVCLLCYRPAYAHWPAFAKVVSNEIAWPSTLAFTPLSITAAILMLALLGLYVSATVVFGLRFSNLSNRGVITSGPYRLMKHPAYFAHAANAWILCLVLLPAGGIDLGLGRILVPLAFTLLYRLRAVTEERHMSEDAAYVAYARWIEQHGLLATVMRAAGLRRQADV
jgi:protein-S-isoprenylcysteine O-methyltransferase Ste14